MEGDHLADGGFGVRDPPLKRQNWSRSHGIGGSAGQQRTTTYGEIDSDKSYKIPKMGQNTR